MKGRNEVREGRRGEEAEEGRAGGRKKGVNEGRRTSGNTLNLLAFEW
jgi:hypothetical protein